MRRTSDLKFIAKLGFAALALMLAASLLLGNDKSKDSKSKDSKTAVDAGSFGVFVSGRRVATETFSVHQQADGDSTISSEVKDEGGSASQRSEMKITSAGALVRYEWHQLSPGKSSLAVAPNNEFLLETITDNPGTKPAEQPFILPNSSPILDNNFFVHREVLAWRYLGSSCTSEAGGMKCSAGEFGVLIPQDRLSSHVTLTTVGDEKITIRGVEQVLIHLDLKGDDGDWSFWLNANDHYKLMRVTKAGQPVEVLRD
jgi:hypothetical protein